MFDDVVGDECLVHVGCPADHILDGFEVFGVGVWGSGVDSAVEHALRESPGCVQVYIAAGAGRISQQVFVCLVSGLVDGGR
ncbi:Uncharacterised protein [Mycobacteroides abscessus subsp. massiliense]|nr:Uncharacterised protein [Mycobacteroides abscessus subsp. massiliense]